MTRTLVKVGVRIVAVDRETDKEVWGVNIWRRSKNNGQFLERAMY